MQTKKSFQKIIFKCLVLLFLISLASCASWGGTDYKRGGRKPQKESANVPKEIRRPGEQQFAAVNTPARKASMENVTKGKVLIEKGKYEKAMGKFQEAVIIDSSNGVAYYYMSKTSFLINQHEKALGILDKAESLLNTSPEWMEAISLLRNQIQESYLSKESQKENSLIPIINTPDN